MQKTEKRLQIIAEIGCNHKGDLEIAKEMIQVAANHCGADVAKFQKRSNRDLLSEEVYNSRHPVPANSYGKTYGEHREFLEFDLDQHKELVEECKQNGIQYSTSVWDLKSAMEITQINPPLIKIPSATNLHFELQNFLCENYSGEIHVSTGMTKPKEIETVIEFYKERSRAKDLVVYACTSGYPVPFEDLCLFEITNLMERYGDSVKGIGFSGHHLGISADIAALTIGRMNELKGNGRFTHIERHFTLDRTWVGTDHAASLEPDGMRKLCRDIHNIDLALEYKKEGLLPIELVQHDKLKWKPQS